MGRGRFGGVFLNGEDEVEIGAFGGIRYIWATRRFRFSLFWARFSLRAFSLDKEFRREVFSVFSLVIESFSFTRLVSVCRVGIKVVRDG